MLRLLVSTLALVMCLATLGFAQGPGAGQSGGTKLAQPPVIINLNTASSAELEVLPGIGAKVAARIIEYRQKKGPFKKIEELMNIPGIGEKSFLKLRPQLTVAAKADAGQH